MTTESRLDALYKTCPRITMDPPVVFIADTHGGDQSKADNYYPYRFHFERAMGEYEPPWKIITLGDMVDNWQFGDKVVWPNYRIPDISIPGNHDWEIGGPEAVILSIGGQEIFCTHGHQGDRFSDQWRGIGRFFVRYFWTPLERLGVKQPQLPGERHAVQRVRLIDWSNTRKIQSVFGHLHTFEETGFTHVCESPITGRMIFTEFTANGWNARSV